MYMTETSEYLSRLKGKWNGTRREIIWFWLTLPTRRIPIPLDRRYSRDLHKKLTNIVHEEKLIDAITTEILKQFLPNSDFSWIDASGRQPTWLLREFLRVTELNVPQFVAGLEARDKLIAFIDWWDRSLSDKASTLQGLKQSWVEKQREDQHFRWYVSAGKERQKCELAWWWYQENHRDQLRDTLKFSGVEDVLAFLDQTKFTLEEKRFHLEQIKKKFKAQQAAANRKGKRQTNLSLSEEVRQMLEKLSEAHRMPRTEIVELLIHNAHVHGMPD